MKLKSTLHRFLFLLLMAFQSELGAQCPFTTPYVQSFAGLPANNQLPACWTASGLGTSCLTFSNPSEAAFTNTATAGPAYFASPSFSLNAGVVYSVGIAYRPVPTGAPWNNLELLLSNSANPVNPTTIIATSSFTSSSYSTLSGSFTVASSAVFYIIIRADYSATPAGTLFWDYFSLTAPCDIASNIPTISISPSGSVYCQSQAPAFLTASGANTYTWNNSVVSSTVALSPWINMHTVVGTNTNSGCSSTSTKTITINPDPNLIVIPTKSLICSGDSTKLTGYGADSYTWHTQGTGGTINVYPVATTVYTVTGQSSMSCTAEKTIQINVLPAPAVVVTAEKYTVCLGESITFTAQGGSTYKWPPSNIGTTLQTVSMAPAVTGSVFVLGTDSIGCSAYGSVFITVESCAGTAERAQRPAYVISPGPFWDELQIITEEPSYSYRIFNTEGRVISSGSGHRTEKVNTSGFPAGNYVVAIEPCNHRFKCTKVNIR